MRTELAIGIETDGIIYAAYLVGDTILIEAELPGGPKVEDSFHLLYEPRFGIDVGDLGEMRDRLHRAVLGVRRLAGTPK